MKLGAVHGSVIAGMDGACVWVCEWQLLER